MDIEKRREGGERTDFVEHHDPAAELERVEERVRRAARAFSDPTQVIGPSGEANTASLEAEMEAALQEVKQARSALENYRNAQNGRLH